MDRETKPEPEAPWPWPRRHRRARRPGPIRFVDIPPAIREEIEARERRRRVAALAHADDDQAEVLGQRK
jgi:hypothetical protein